MVQDRLQQGQMPYSPTATTCHTHFGPIVVCRGLAVLGLLAGPLKTKLRAMHCVARLCACRPYQPPPPCHAGRCRAAYRPSPLLPLLPSASSAVVSRASRESSPVALAHTDAPVPGTRVQSLVVLSLGPLTTPTPTCTHTHV